MEERRQLRRELLRILSIAWVADRRFDCGQSRTQAAVSDLHRLQLRRRELYFAIHVFRQEFFDSCDGVLVALLLRARLEVFHAFDAGHAGQNPVRKAKSMGRGYACGVKQKQLYVVFRLLPCTADGVSGKRVSPALWAVVESSDPVYLASCARGCLGSLREVGLAWRLGRPVYALVCCRSSAPRVGHGWVMAAGHGAKVAQGNRQKQRWCAFALIVPRGTSALAPASHGAQTARDLGWRYAEGFRDACSRHAWLC